MFVINGGPMCCHVYLWTLGPKWSNGHFLYNFFIIDVVSLFSVKCGFYFTIFTYFFFYIMVARVDLSTRCFPPILSFLLSSDLWSRILLFLSSPFFLFFLFISSFGNSGFSIRYLLSLEEILLCFSSGERMRILFIGQGSK